MKGTFCASLPTGSQLASPAWLPAACSPGLVQFHLKGRERWGCCNARSSAPPSDWWEQIQRAPGPSAGDGATNTLPCDFKGEKGQYQHCIQLVSPREGQSSTEPPLRFTKWVNNEQSCPSSNQKTSMPNQQQQASGHYGLGEEQATLRSATEKRLTPSYRAHTLVCCLRRKCHGNF